MAWLAGQAAQSSEAVFRHSVGTTELHFGAAALDIRLTAGDDFHRALIHG